MYQKLFSAYFVIRSSSLSERKSSSDDAPALAPGAFDPSAYFPSFCGRRPLMPNPAEARIVGGESAAKGQFPWQAQLWMAKTGKRPSFQCGGTLVAEDLVWECTTLYNIFVQLFCHFLKEKTDFFVDVC